MSLLIEVQNILSDAFEENLFIIPLQSSLEDGIYDNTVKNSWALMSVSGQCRSKHLTPWIKAGYTWQPRIKENQLELLPLIKVKDEVCYFYNGKNMSDGLSRYVSYYNEDKAEISLPEDENLVGLLKYKV
jgi:hypothetical protein